MPISESRRKRDNLELIGEVSVVTFPRPSNLSVAVAIAKSGFPVFPCKERGPKGVIKSPYTRHGHKEATTDLEKIKEWWRRHPDAVVGLPTGERSGLAVIDLDVRADGRDGESALEAAGINVESTVRVRTPSGGLHLYFRWSDGIGNATGILPGVDVRGEGGYVVAPGSRMGDGARYKHVGRSRLDDDCIRLSRFPTEIRDMMSRRHPEGEGEVEPIGLTLDQARSYLDELANDPEWRDRRDGWLKVGMGLHHEFCGDDEGFGLWREFSEDSEFYNLRELRQQWRSFREDRANPVTFGSIIDAARGGDALTTAEARALFEENDIPIEPRPSAPLEWFGEITPALDSTYLIKGLIDVGSLSVMWGNPKSGKTFAALDMMYRLASGQSWRGRRTRQAAVLYLALEGGNRIKNRIVAIQNEHGDERIPFALRRAGLDLLNKNSGDVRRIVDLHREVKAAAGDLPTVIVVDTLSRALAGGDESSSVDMTAFIRNVDAIREQTGAHVMVVHHAGKDVSRGMRGHSSLMGAIDHELFVEHDEGTGIRTLRVGVQRDEDSTGQEFPYRLRSVEVGTDQDGDPVTSAVCEPVTGSLAEDLRQPLNSSERVALGVLKGLAGDSDHASLNEWKAACVASDHLFTTDKLDSRRRVFDRWRDELVRKERISINRVRDRVTIIELQIDPEEFDE